MLPVFAEANVSIRLAPGQKVEEIAPVFERLLRESAPKGADVESRLARGPSRAGRAGLAGDRARPEAFERATGARPLLVRSGGTLPIVPALERRGIPTIVTGFAVPGANAHAPNERLLLEYLPLGIRSAEELFRAWAALGETD